MRSLSLFDLIGPSAFPSSPPRPYLDLLGYEHFPLVFWFGDLNYRVDESIPTVRVMELSKAGMLEELIEHDQLNIERAAGRVFRDFEEGPLEFKPILFVALSFCTAATTIAQQGRKWQSVK